MGPAPAQNIPIGLATKLMAIIGSLFGLITAVSVVIHGDLSQDTVTTMILSAVSFFILAGGRYAQAALATVNRNLG
jgi:flagellar motor component MotA